MRKTLNKMLAILLIAVMVTTLAPIESEAASRIYLEASVNNGATSLIINETDIYQVTEAGATKEIGFSEDLTFWLLTEDKMLYWYNYKCQGSSTIQFYLMDTNVISLVRNSDNRVTGYVASDEEKAIFTEEQVKIIVENNLSQGIDIPIKSTITPTPTSIPMYYEVSMRVNNGKMVLTINETENYEITGTGVTKDGGFSEDCTLWLLTTDQKLFWYSYEYQGSDFVKLHLLDTNVESLIRNSDDRVIGYVSNSVNKSVLSEEQIKLIIDNNISAEIDIPIKATPEPTATSTPRPTATATPEPTATSTPRPTATATPEPTATSTPRPTATATPEPTATSTSRPTATATLEPTATLTPKPTATVTLKPIITSTPRPTVTATLKPIVTSKPRPTATVTLKPTATPTPKVTYAARVNTQGIRKELYNSKEKRVDTFKLKKGTLTYHGWCVKNVKIAEFNVKGNVMVITKKGKLISINYKTMKKKTIKKSGIKSFRYNSKGMATYAIDKKNKKIKLSKY